MITYFDDNYIYITIGIIFYSILYFKYISNNKKLNDIDFRLNTIIGGINAHSKMLTNVFEVLNKNETNISYAFEHINNSNETLVNTLFDENEGIIAIIESIKTGIYNDDIGLLHNINTIQTKISQNDLIINEIKESQKEIKQILNNNIIKSE